VEDSGLLQMRATLSGSLHVSAFEAAWADTWDRHPVLRSSVHWEGVQHPVQMVNRSVRPAIRVLDWSDRPASQVGPDLDRLLDTDAAQGLDLTIAPVSRLTLIRTDERTHRLAWTAHHILLDGWSTALVVREVMSRYEASIGDRTAALAPAGARYRDYVSWVRTVDDADAERFWRSQRITEPCLVSAPRWNGSGATGARRTLQRRLVPGPRVDAWAREHQVTPATVYAGCWALVLSRATGSRRPLFGTAVSGRGSGFPGLDTMVGMCANTVPAPIEVVPAESVSAWFSRVAAIQNAVRGSEHCSFSRIMEWCGSTWPGPMFDTLLVLANYQGADRLAEGLVAAAPDGQEPLTLNGFRGGLTSAYPLTLAVTPGDGNVASAHFHTSLVDETNAERFLEGFARAVEAVVGGAQPTVDDVLRSLSDLPDPAAATDPAPLGTGVGSTNGAAGAADTARTGRRDEAAAPPPRDDFESQLMRIWAELLDLPEIGRHDNFFDLGGHSLLMPRLVARVQRDFGVEIPLGVIFRSPTVEGLAAFVREADPDRSWPSLVAIAPDGDRTPLFMVHGLGGEIGQFYHLAAYLPSEQPLYALQSPAEPSRKLERIAGRYLEEVRAVQPSGPYRLGGYCLGGTVAFEMARQLEAEGQEVSFLGLVDSVAPGAVQRPVPQHPPPTVGQHLRVFLTRNPLVTVARVRRRIGIWRELRRNPPTPARTLDPDTGDVIYRGLMPRAFHEAASRHLTALESYQGGPLSAPVHLFRTHSPRFDADLGWNRFAPGGLELTWLDGPHPEVLKEPYLSASGPQIARALDATVDSAPVRQG
jgi:thioesterase domain-containing protein/acyl carrier protein